MLLTFYTCKLRLQLYKHEYSGISTLCITTLTLATFCTTTLSITTFSKMTHSITPVSIMSLSIKTFSITIKKCDTQHNDSQHTGTLCSVAMLSVICCVSYAEYRYTECRSSNTLAAAKFLAEPEFFLQNSWWFQGSLTEGKAQYS